MSEENYQEIRQKLQECFEKQEMEKGLKIALEIKEKFPDHASAAYFNLAYFQALLNLTEETVETLEEGYEKGLWWAESQIRLFPNYDQLVKNEKFYIIVNKYFDRYKKIREDTPFKWIVCTPENYDSSRKYPVLIALHQGDGNIEETEKKWKYVLEHDVLLAIPQSSEITGPNTFTWMDLDSGLNELSEIHSQIMAKYQIDLNNVFLSGFSIGGTLALEATFIHPKFSVNGCIAVNPSLIQPNVISQNFERAKKEGVKCCILAGTDDPEYEKIKELATLLKRENVHNKFYELAGLGHTFPNNFEEFLEEMMKFFLMN